jgi:predicted ABC-type ATPase
LAAFFPLRTRWILLDGGWLIHGFTARSVEQGRRAETLLVATQNAACLDVCSFGIECSCGQTRRRTSNQVEDIVILGGPNGAGKTTAAQVVLPEQLDIREFVNADEIARGLSPFNPGGAALAAGRLMIERIQNLVQDRRSFALETTCAGRGHIGLLRRCKADGWRVTLVYLWLPSVEAALDRVARRVRQGGHDVPESVVVRRYWAGVANMHDLYLPLADLALIYDNSDAGRALIAERTPGHALVVHDARRWALIKGAKP